MPFEAGNLEMGNFNQHRELPDPVRHESYLNLMSGVHRGFAPGLPCAGGYISGIPSTGLKNIDLSTQTF